MLSLFTLYSWGQYEDCYSFYYNYEIRIADLGESKGCLESKQEYQQMIEDLKDKYSFGQQSISQPLKLNQPFILYNLKQKKSL